MARQISFGEVASESKVLAFKHASLLLAVGAAIAALYAVLDWMTEQTKDSGGALMISLVFGFAMSVFIQYLVVEELLADRMTPIGTRGPRRYLSLFGAQLLSGLAIGAGAILLILPGIYLAGRWLTMTQQIVENRLPATESLEASWKDSQESQPAFIAALLIGISPTLISITIQISPDLLGLTTESWILKIGINLLEALTYLAGWVIATAAYRKAVPADHRVGEVFV